MNVLIFLSIAGIAAIIFLIHYYRRKSNSGALLAQNHATNDAKYESNKSAENKIEKINV